MYVLEPAFRRLPIRPRLQARKVPERLWLALLHSRRRLLRKKQAKLVLRLVGMMEQPRCRPNKAWLSR